MDADIEPSRVVNSEQAARRLGISVGSLRKQDIPTVKYAGRRFYRVEDLDEFIDNHVVEAA